MNIDTRQRLEASVSYFDREIEREKERNRPKSVTYLEECRNEIIQKIKKLK